MTKFLMGLARMRKGVFGARLSTINGQSGYLIVDGEKISGAVILDIAEDQIQTFRFVLNPDKLQHFKHRLEI